MNICMHAKKPYRKADRQTTLTSLDRYTQDLLANEDERVKTQEIKNGEIQK